MAIWPTTLPQELHQQGFSIQNPTGAVRTDMETGKAFQRRRYTAAVQPVSGQMFLTKEQYTTLLVFWRDTLGMGALEFDWVHPITGDLAKFRFNSNNPPQLSAVTGDLYQVRLSLEIVP